MLNDKQRIRFLLGLALFVIALCPPWKEFGAQEKPLGFAPMFTPPPVSATASKVDIDFSRLGIEVALVAALGFLLLPPRSTGRADFRTPCC